MLCKDLHNKGKVERLIRFVKENFVVGRTFGNITDLNLEALKWCNEQNGKYHKAVDCIPADKHKEECMKVAREFTLTLDMHRYLAPLRKISFDGFVNYEGRRFGVPRYYCEKTCRIERDGFYIKIYDKDLNRVLTTHNVTWSRKDSFCIDQYSDEPEEQPTAPVKAVLHQHEEVPEIGFEKFDFGKKVHWND